MHAVADAPLEETNNSEFISFIDADFERLIGLAENTMQDARFVQILSSECRPGLE